MSPPCLSCSSFSNESTKCDSCRRIDAGHFRGGGQSGCWLLDQQTVPADGTWLHRHQAPSAVRACICFSGDKAGPGCHKGAPIVIHAAAQKMAFLTTTQMSVLIAWQVLALCQSHHSCSWIRSSCFCCAQMSPQETSE